MATRGDRFRAEVSSPYSQGPPTVPKALLTVGPMGGLFKKALCTPACRAWCFELGTWGLGLRVSDLKALCTPASGRARRSVADISARREVCCACHAAPSSLDGRNEIWEPITHGVASGPDPVCRVSGFGLWALGFGLRAWGRGGSL